MESTDVGLHCLADLDVIFWSDPLENFRFSLSELEHPISCFSELWEFLFVFFSPRTSNKSFTFSPFLNNRLGGITINWFWGLLI